MGDRALKAVAAFFNRYNEFDDAEMRAQYAMWAAPEPEEKTDKKGQKVLVLPELYPYMWREVDETDPNNIVSDNYE